MTANMPAAWVTQAQYAKELRPRLPPEAFKASKDRILILAINLAILLCGWAMAKHLNQWGWQLLWLYLPFTMLMGNSVIALLFSSHELMHSSAIRRPILRRLASILGLAMLWMPPTLWLVVHNKEHHGKTNSNQDPDRNYLFHQATSWGKWIQNLFVPSLEVHPFWLAVGMSSAWGVHAFRNLTSVLLFNDGSTRYPVFSFTVSQRKTCNRHQATGHHSYSYWDYKLPGITPGLHLAWILFADLDWLCGINVLHLHKSYAL
jgi:fatty acid desaturase